MSEVTSEVRNAVINDEINQLNIAICRQSVRYAVNERVNDTKGMEACKKAMEDLELRKRAYEEELNKTA